MTSLLRAWAQDKDTQLERALAVLGLSRALLLLPPDQSAFAPSTAAFTRHVPELVWGTGALALSIWVWLAASRPKNYANRRNAARALVAHSLVLFPLYVLSNPWATIGWYHLLFALCAAVLTYARSSDLHSSKGAEGSDSQSAHSPRRRTALSCGAFIRCPSEHNRTPLSFPPLTSDLWILDSDTSCPTP